MVGAKKELSLLQGDKGFVNKVLSRRSSVSGCYPGFSGRYYPGDNVEVPFVWEDQPGKPKEPSETEVVLPPKLHLSYEEVPRLSTHYDGDGGQVPFQWEMLPGKPWGLPEHKDEETWPRPYPDLEKNKESRPSPQSPVLSLSLPNMCVTPGGSARWVKRLLWKKFSKMSKKVRRVRSEPREACGRCRVSGSERFGSYNYFSNSDEDYARTSSGSSNSVQSPVASSSSVRPLVHSSKFQMLAKGLSKWVKL